MHPSSFWAMLMMFGMFAFLALCVFVLLCAVALIRGAVQGIRNRIEQKHIDDADVQYEGHMLRNAGSVQINISNAVLDAALDVDACVCESEQRAFEEYCAKQGYLRINDDCYMKR